MRKFTNFLVHFMGLAVLGLAVSCQEAIRPEELRNSSESLITTPQFSAALPAYADYNGGDVISITGQKLPSDTQVLIGGQPCDAQVYFSQSQIQCQTPARAIGVYDIELVFGSHDNITVTNGFEYLQAPSVTDVYVSAAADPLPVAGSTAGGLTITVEGTEFDAGPTVTINNQPCVVDPVSVTATSLECDTGASLSAGLFAVRVINSNGASDSLANSFQYVDPPTISAVNPSYGTTLGGETIAVSGSRFDATSVVAIGPNSCATTYFASNSIQCDSTTSTAAGIYDVTVTNTVNTYPIVGTSVGAFAFNTPPSITNVEDAATTFAFGPSTAAHTIRVTGNNLVSGSKIVLIDATLVETDVDANCDYTGAPAAMECDTDGTQADGVYDVVVELASGMRSPVFATPYTLTPAPAITNIEYNAAASGVDNGPESIGHNFVITGTDFDTSGTSSVALANGADSAVFTCSTDSGTQITCPYVGGDLQAGTYNAQVTGADGQVSNSFSSYTLNPQPTVTLIDKNVGDVNGNFSVRVNGSNLLAGATITFGGADNCAEDATDPSGGFIDCTVGLFGVAKTHGSQVGVTVTNPDGQTFTLNNAFEYRDSPTVTSVTGPTDVTVAPNANGKASGGETITIIGTNFLASATVKIGSYTCANASVTVPGTEIQCDTPTGMAAGTYPVQVINTDTMGSNTDITFEAVAAPTISNVVNLADGNQYGPYISNHTIRITGTGFLAGYTVEFADGTNDFSYADVTNCVLDNSSAVHIIDCSYVAETHVGSVYNVKVVNSDTQETAADTYEIVREHPVVSASIPVLSAYYNDNTTSITIPGEWFETIGGVDPAVEIFNGSQTYSCAVTNVVAGAVGSIDCVVPYTIPGTYNIKVTLADGKESNEDIEFYSNPDPTFISVSDNTDIPAGGKTITVTGTTILYDWNGTGLHTEIQIDGQVCAITTPATDIDSVGGTVTCDVPAQSSLATGDYDISIINPDGGSVTETEGFHYLELPQVSSIYHSVNTADANGPYTIDHSFVIEGDHFRDDGMDVVFTHATSADFDITNCVVDTGATPQTITCDTADIPLAHDPVTYTIEARNSFGQTSVDGFTYTFDPAPVLSSFTLAQAPATLTATVQINGSNFITDNATTAGTTTVAIGGYNCAVDPASATTTLLNCDTLGAETPGDYKAVLTNPDGQVSVEDVDFTFITGPTITGVSPSSVNPGPAGTTIQVVGRDFYDDGASVSQVSFSDGTITHQCSGESVNLAKDIITCSTPDVSADWPVAPATYQIVNLVVTNPDGYSQEYTLTNGFQFTDPPTLSAVDSGAAYGNDDTGPQSTAHTISFTTVGTFGQPRIHFTDQSDATNTFYYDNCSSPDSGVTWECSYGADQAAGTYDVKIINPDNQESGVIAYTFEPKPVIGTVENTTAPNAGQLHGPVNAIHNVQITGSDFLAGTVVKINGVTYTPNAVDTLSTPNVLDFDTSGAETAGTFNVVLEHPDGQISVESFSYTFYDAPDITGITPQFGSNIGNFSVTIAGTNLRPDIASVTIGGISCNVDIPNSDSTKIECDVGGIAAQADSGAGPGSGDTGVDVVYSNNDTAPTDSLTGANGFYWKDRPTVASIADDSGGDDSGPMAGGELVITGANFITHPSVPSVRVGSTVCSVTAATATSITCDLGERLPAPVNTTEIEDVKILNYDGQLNDHASEPQYTWDPPPVINDLQDAVTLTTNGAPSGEVHVYVDNWVAGASITIGGNACAYLSKPSYVRCTTPSTPGEDLAVVVTNPDGQSSMDALAYDGSLSAKTFTINPLMEIGSLHRIEGGSTFSNIVAADTDGQIVGVVGTVGTEFFASTVVQVNGTNCVSTALASNAQINCEVPNLAAGSYALTVTNPDGQTDSATLVYEPEVTITDITPNVGSASGGQDVTITGTNLDIVNTLEFGNVDCNITSESATQIICRTGAFAFPPDSGDTIAVDMVIVTDGNITHTFDGVYSYANTGVEWSTLSESVDYGTGAAGTPIDRTFILENNGTAVSGAIVVDLGVPYPALDCPALTFIDMAGTCNTAGSLNAAETCDIVIRFDPDQPTTGATCMVDLNIEEDGVIIIQQTLTGTAP